MKKIRFNYYLLCQILIVFILTFFAGYFLPAELIGDNLKIFEVFITIFGIAITLFTFIQGVIQSSKSNLLKTSIKIEDIKDKFMKLDDIINELKGDVLFSLTITIIYGGIALFFGSIDNLIWQQIFVYIKYFLIFMLVFVLIDLTITMFKLVKINNILNLKITENKNNKENKDE